MIIPDVDLSKRPLSKRDWRKVESYILKNSSPNMRESYKRRSALYDEAIRLLKEQRKLIHLWYSAYKYEKIENHEKRIKILESA